jgi:hypothetical protein
MAAGFLRIARIALLLGGTAVAQQLAQPATGQQPTAAPTAAPASDPQAVAKSGLLPIYGVELGVDKTWIDGDKFPSQSTRYPNGNRMPARNYMIRPANNVTLRLLSASQMH